MKSKKQLLAPLLALLLLQALPVCADSERVQSWTLVYETALSDAQKLAVMSQIIDFRDRDFLPFMVKSLDRLEQENIEKGDSTQVQDKSTLAILLIRELGAQYATDAIPAMGKLYLYNKNVFVKSEAAISLGLLGAEEYLPAMLRELSGLNLAPPKDGTDSRNKEILAYGLVRALGNMKDMRAYAPLFLSTIAWYSPVSRVKSTAREMLQSLSGDPTVELMKIIPSLGDFGAREAALDLALESKALADKKNATARLVLSECIRAHVDDPMDKTNRAHLIMKCLKALEDGKDADPAGIDSFRIIIREAQSTDTMLSAYRTAGANSSDESARFLAENLIRFNDRQKSGLNTDDDRILIRQIVASMARQKNRLTRDALSQAEFASHDSQVVREIKAALQTY